MLFNRLKYFIMTLASCTSVAASAGLEPVNTVEGISSYVLSNGLKVVLFEDSSKPTATVNTTYLVGSRHESYGETGMAHLLEHLMFKGSKNYPDPTKEFARRGFRMNGTTWLDRTNYFVSFTATDDNMRWALGWSADAMVNSNIAKSDLDTEMTVVRNEFEMGENKPTRVMLKRMQSVIYDWHNYAHSTIGARSDIENVPIENIRAFYQKWYQPDNAVLTVSGRFDSEKVLGWIKESFGKIPKPTRVLPQEWTVEPVADGPRYFEIRRPGEMQMVAVAYRVPSALAKDAAAVDAAVEILSDAPRGRLYKALVETGLASQIFGWSMSTKDPGFVLFGAMVKKGDAIDPVKAKMLEVLEGEFTKAPVTEEELKILKADNATDFERALSDPEEFAVDLSDYIALGDWRLFFLARDRIAALNAKDIDKAAATYFVRDNRVLGLFIPDKDTKRAPLMQTPTLESVLAGVKFKAEGDVAEAFDVDQENIVKRTERFSIGEISVALLPKKTRGKTVTVMTDFRYGNLKASSGKAALDRLLGSMLLKGAKNLTKTDIANKMTELKIQGDVFTFTCTRETLEESLRFMAELETTSNYPEKEVTRTIKQMSTALEGKSDDPVILARDAVRKHFRTYPEGDPRNAQTTAEFLKTLKSTTRKEAYAWYNDVFSTEHGAVAIVGDFDPKAVRAALEATLGKKKSQGKANAYTHYEAQFKAVPAKRIVIDTPQKENATIFARIDFKGELFSEEAPAIEVANWILGGGTSISNRLINRLRQKEGLSYSVYSQALLPVFGDRASWVGFAIVAPQNLAKAEKSMKDEIKRAVDKGFTKKEVEEAITGLLQYRAVNRSQDAYLASSWITYMLKGKDFLESKAYEDRLRRLTVKDVNAALRLMIDPAAITYVLAGDVAKAKAANADFTNP